jgi:lipopolysaccharide assembly outer membrane protein LptD (OstA)
MAKTNQNSYTIPILRFYHSHVFSRRVFSGIVFLQLLILHYSHSQSADTLITAKADSVARQDTTKKKSSGIDTSVVYSAVDSIVYSYPKKVMMMYGKGDVKYRTLGLKSERIDVNWNDNNLDSYGVLDSSKIGKTDSLKKLYRGTPVMIDGGETYEGWKIGYNFKSQKGLISLGETEMDQSYYHGEQIKKVDKNMMFIANGIFTSCDLDHPHYFFFSPRMRVTIQDKIVAEPIYLYVADVPVFVLPFGVFPSQGGRRSGIIAPSYGDDAQRGKYISHLGYYDAISDYTDLAVAGDWYPEGGWQALSNFRYAKRYDFSGALTGEYSRLLIGELNDPGRTDQANYRVNLTHNQTIDPTTRLDVNFTFASNNSYKTSNNYDDYLQQQLYSNATLSKSWEGTSNSMSLNISRTQDLLQGSITATIPTINFSHSQSYPFRSEVKSRGLSDNSGSNYAWYELIGVGYNGQFMNEDNKTATTDSLTYPDKFVRYNRLGVSHSFTLNASPKAGYFTISPSFNYNERWYDKSVTADSVNRAPVLRAATIGVPSVFTLMQNGVNRTTDGPVLRDVDGLEAVRFFNMGVSASTKLYGMFQPPIPGVAGFRHTITPSISYNYQPDFSKPGWGYYGTYRDTLGKQVSYDRFQREVYGGAPAGESQAIGLNVGNLFEMKTEDKDSVNKGSKYQLLNLGASMSYNFAADQFKVSDLALSYRTDIGQYLAISGSNNYRFYDFDPVLHERVNKLLFDEGKGIAELTNFNINLSTSLHGEKKKRENDTHSVDSTVNVENQAEAFRQNGYRGIYDEEPPDFSIPWNLGLSFSFAQNEEDPTVKTRAVNVNANLGFNLTENWKFSATTSYDLVQRQVAAPRITIDRDLHCWTMNFSWVPSGALAGYRFELKVKAPQLQDIKLTKQSLNSGYN